MKWENFNFFSFYLKKKFSDRICYIETQAACGLVQTDIKESVYSVSNKYENVLDSEM